MRTATPGTTRRLLTGRFLFLAAVAVSIPSLPVVSAERPVVPEPVFARLLADEVKGIAGEVRQIRGRPNELRGTGGDRLRTRALLLALAVRQYRGQRHPAQLVLLGNAAVGVLAGARDGDLARVEEHARALERLSALKPDAAPDGKAGKARDLPAARDHSELADAMRVFMEQERGGEGVGQILQELAGQANARPPRRPPEGALLAAYKSALVGQFAATGDVAEHERARATPGINADDWFQDAEAMRTASLALVKSLDQKDPGDVRRPAARLTATCTQCHSTKGWPMVPHVLDALRAGSAEARAIMTLAVSANGPWDRRLVPVLRRALTDESPVVRGAAVIALERFPWAADSFLPDLVERLKDANESVHQQALSEYAKGF